MAATRARVLSVSVATLAAVAGCENPRSDNPSFFERRVAPILRASCAGTAPCHRDDGAGNAQGNLDVTSYQSLLRRRDVLTRSGSYPEPLLLIKAVASQGLDAPYQGRFAPLEIPHGGGHILDVGGPAYFTLKRWLDNGATEDGAPPASRTRTTGEGPCRTRVPDGIDPAEIDPADPGLERFRALQPWLVASCGAGSCHGTPLADFALTCGSDDVQTRANYLMTRAFLAPNVADSELLTRPLDPLAGGQDHAGGVHFASRRDADYLRLADFATAVGPLPDRAGSPARTFFEARVMPILLRRGCAMPACHSPLVVHKLKLRGGSYGFFSRLALDRNHHELRDSFLALESPDARLARFVAKNVIASHGGIQHRAGALLESPADPPDPSQCPPDDPRTATPLCTIAEWRRLERAEQPASYRADPAATSAPLIYIERPASAATLLDFASFQPGADLIRTTATLAPGGRVVSVTGRVSLLAGCPGVGADRAAVDVRGPEVSHDARRVLFAMRLSSAGGLDLYQVGIDGSGCRRLTSDGGQTGNGITIDNFDPYPVIDRDGVEWVVYASTRGGAEGPARSPRSFLPDADLWRQPLAGGAPERMTVLRGVEAEPAMMADGQLIFTVEKQSPDFYQIAARRLNWDLSDYHPLLAQRRSNYQGRGGFPGPAPAGAVLRPSIGFGIATEVREDVSGDFLVILSDTGGAGQGGALGVFNRSLGPFEAERSDPAFAPALTLLSGPSGRGGSASGLYRSPSSLPDGSILASYAAGVDAAQVAPVSFDLVVVDRITGARRSLISGPTSEVEAQLAWPREPPRPFMLSPDPQGATADTAIVHFPDLPLLATILDSNNRRGRDVQPLRAAARVRFFTYARPPAACRSPTDAACAPSMSGPMAVYAERRELGWAPLEADGSVYLALPTRLPVSLELLDDSGAVLFRQREENQFGPFETIGVGVPESSFDAMCAGCHGSVSGRELDVHVDIDALTAASTTLARARAPRVLTP